jgi:chaperonin GroEL (HSP60 family)
VGHARLTVHKAVSSTTELGCKRLVLTHIGAQMHNRLAEVTEEVAGDGLVITLGER